MELLVDPEFFSTQWGRVIVIWAYVSVFGTVCVGAQNAISFALED